MEYGAVIVLASMVMQVQGCSDVPRLDGKEMDEMKVFYSDAVVFGTVLEITDSHTPGIKNMEFEVTCSYKGNVDQQLIHVTGVGNKKKVMPDCPVVRVNIGEKVALFLKKLPKKAGKSWFDVEYTPLRGDASVFLDDLTFVCGLNLTYGVGHSECYDPLIDECEPYILPEPEPNTTAAPVDTKTTEDIVVGPPVDPESSEAENDGPNSNGNNHSYETKTDKPDNTNEDPKAVGAKDDNGSTKQATVSALAIIISFVIAAFV